MTNQTNLRRGTLLLIVILAFGLRLYRLGAESLWYDETVSLLLAGKSLPALVAHTAGDIHPPGYYLLLHLWIRLAGRSEFSAAFLSLFFGLLLVPLTYRLAVRIWDEGTGQLSALLVAISPYHIWYSQEVRMYTVAAVLGLGVLMAVLSLLSTGSPFRARLPSLPGSRWIRPASGWILYVVCGALGLWVLYYFAFLLLAVNLMAGLWWALRRRQMSAGGRWLGGWALAQTGVLLLYAPWLPIAWRQATDPPVPPWREFTNLGALLVESWSALSLGQSASPNRVWPVLLLFLALFLVGLFYRPGHQSDRRSVPWLLAGSLLLPILLIYLASWITPLYHVRYVFPYSAPFYLLVGAGLASLPRCVHTGRWRRAGQWGRGVSLAVLLFFSGASLCRYHTDPHLASDDHRSAVRFLEDRWRPGDAILINAGYVYPALLTYWHGDPIAWRGRLGSEYDPTLRQGLVIFQTGSVDGDPSLGWGDPDSDFYAISQADTAEALTRLFADFDRVWVYRLYDTVTDPTGLIRRWLDKHGILFEDQVFTGEGQLRVQGFLTGRDPLAGPWQPAGATLRDGSLELVASSSLPSAVEVGKNLDLPLVWQVASAPDEGAILFAGLFDEAGERWAQTDERPLGTLYPPDRWPQGAQVRTPLRLWVPPGTPPGSYRLEIGWYRFVDGQPFWIPWTSDERLVLGSVQVIAPQDWSALPLPDGMHLLHITIGPGVRLLGVDMPQVGHASDALPLTLFWQALADHPTPGSVVLQLADDAGRVWAESSSAPLAGRVPLTGLEAGQVLRDPRLVLLPGDLPPGVYSVRVGRRNAAGDWFPIRRGPFRLGSTYPLATIPVLGRTVVQTPPIVQHPMDVRLGDTIRLVGYDLQGSIADGQLVVTLHWHALRSMAIRYKIFLHLTGEGGPADLRAQIDAWPRLPTSGWQPGEYASDRLTLALPRDLPPGRYTLRCGLYDEATGERLPVVNQNGQMIGDHLILADLAQGE